MAWKPKFESWIAAGKTKEWLLARIEFLFVNYPDQFLPGEYQEILDLINALP